MATATSGEPRWSEWRRPRPTPAQQRRDVWLALGVVLGGLGMTVLVSSMGAFAFESPPSLTEQLLWSLAVTAPLVVRRRYPLLVLLVVGAVFIGAQTRQTGDSFVPSAALFLAIYTAGAWEPNRVVARWSRVGVVVVMFAWLGFALVKFLIGPPHPFSSAAGPLDPVLASVLHSLAFNLVYFVGAYAAGEVAWVSARRQAELEHRAEQLRRSQEQNTRGALVAERMRIARDLHDVVAHHVSVMGIQAAAARRVLDKDRDLARDALKQVEETARVSIGELRGLLGVLRADPEDGSAGERAAPDLDRLPELVATARGAGLEVEHRTFGAVRPVPDAVALSAYRVVQEALTNVVKHARARRVDVRVRYLDRAVEVEVTDDGRGGAGRPAGGFGLLGMRERVAVHGGQLEAGPRRGAGYLVRATLPTTDPAAPAEPAATEPAAEERAADPVEEHA
ncbi:sensor histidine kinase [Saccharothrix longispora]|uniref:sensor histidine kinase n=1 Tax=Saccharothrix longispora TaxID=33920 RepID=UPI0028FD78A3|nr:histidine kinase [Saccharothrix longispora]MDU0288589.1 histidine kinase [Saccharothrix longispora]